MCWASPRLPLLAVFVFFLLAAKDSPKSPPRKTMADYARLLRKADAWWLMFFYSVTFGGFVGLASFLTDLFPRSVWSLAPSPRAISRRGCVFAGSLARPFGGALADRIGGIARAVGDLRRRRRRRLLIVAKGVLPAFGWRLPSFIVAMLALGMGNGAVFQLVPQRFGRDVGVMTGLVGMTGGVGGFYLAVEPRLRQTVHRKLRPRASLRVRGSGHRGLGRHRRGAPSLAEDAAMPAGVARLRRVRHEHDFRSAQTPRRHRQRHGRHAHGRGTAEARGRARYRITVFGAEPHVNYNRIMLSQRSRGRKSFDEIIINSRDMVRRQRHSPLSPATRVTAIDRDAKTVTAESGRSVAYDRLLIATGSRPVAPPIPGLGLPGVCAFRDLADVDKMLAAARIA